MSAYRLAQAAHAYEALAAGKPLTERHRIAAEVLAGHLDAERRAIKRLPACPSCGAAGAQPCRNVQDGTVLAYPHLARQEVTR